MGRMVPNWTKESVEGCEVAPHRFTWNGSNRADVSSFDLKANLQDVRDAYAYEVGDVVYVAVNGKPVRARILYLLLSSLDRFGFRQEHYRVQTETKDGHWSKLWRDAFPGQIQRGYFLAGLAPDLEGKL